MSETPPRVADATRQGPGLVRVSRLHAVGAHVRSEQPVVVEIDLRERRRRPLHVLGARLHDVAESRVAHGDARQRGEIPRARIVVRVLDTARSRVVRVVQPELLRLGVHRTDERPLVSAHRDRKGEGVVVAGVEEQRVEELPRLDSLAGSQALADERDTRDRFVDRHDVVRLQLSQREERRHDLRRRSDLPPLVCISSPEHAPRLPVDKDRGGCEHLRRERVAAAA